MLPNIFKLLTLCIYMYSKNTFPVFISTLHKQIICPHSSKEILKAIETTIAIEFRNPQHIQWVHVMDSNCDTVRNLESFNVYNTGLEIFSSIQVELPSHTLYLNSQYPKLTMYYSTCSMLILNITFPIINTCMHSFKIIYVKICTATILANLDSVTKT